MKIDEDDDLVRRLRADALWLDERTPPITAVDIEERAARDRRPARHPRARGVFVVTVASAVAIAVVVAWGATRSSDSGIGRVRVSTPSTVEESHTASVSANPIAWTGAPLYMEPSAIPAGFSLVDVEGGDPQAGGSSRAGSPEITAAQTWVRFDAAHDNALGVLQIQWGPGARATGLGGKSTTSDPLAGWESTSVKITVRGRTGLYSSFLSGVAWEEPAGQADSVSCQQCSRDELLRIADGLVRRPDGGFTWPHPIDGFQFVSQAPGMASDGTDLRELTYHGPNDTGFIVGIVDDTQEPPFAQLALPKVRIVDIRNSQGVIGPTLNAPLNLAGADNASLANPSLFVQWLEYPNVAITVAGIQISQSQLLAIANSLQQISAQRWSALGGSTPHCCNHATP